MKPLLKINFTYFWKGFKKKDNYFTRLLSNNYALELSQNPDLLFCTHDYLGTKEYLKYNCHKIFIGLENKRNDFNAFDYILDFDYRNQKNHRRFPLWALWNIENLIKEPNVNINKKEKFACMVVSNSDAKERINFFHTLNKYKKVDSGGKFLNNIGGPVSDKLEFIKDYKFVISFENSSHPGYTTEKLIEPMFVNSIPIYWGNNKIGDDFNINSFINIHDYTSYDEAIEKIIELDKNEEEYYKIVRQPWFKDNKVPIEMSKESISNHLDSIIEETKYTKPVSKTYKKYFHIINKKAKNTLWLINKKLTIS